MQKVVLALASLFSFALMACGPVQSPECAEFLVCQRAIDESEGTTAAEQYEKDYGEAGSCWAEDAAHAVRCTDACIAALDSRATAYPDVDACQPSESDED